MQDPLTRSLEELLANYCEGDATAFKGFFDQTKDLVYSYIIRRVTNAEAAQDIFQDTYFRVHRYVASYKSTEGKALSWLLAIANNCIYDFLQASRKAPKTENWEDREETLVPPRAEDLVLLKSLLNHMKTELSPQEIELILDRFVNELSYEEIALKHRIRLEAARQRISRALKKVKAMMRF